MRGGGANALHLSRGNPGYISGLAPLRLDLRAHANEPRPASATKEVVQDDAAALGRYGYDAARGSWASLKIYPSEWRRRKSKEEWSWRDRQWLKYCSTSHGVQQSNKERCSWNGRNSYSLKLFEWIMTLKSEILSLDWLNFHTLEGGIPFQRI